MQRKRKTKDVENFQAKTERWEHNYSKVKKKVNESKVVANSGQLSTAAYSHWSLDKHQYHNRGLFSLHQVDGTTRKVLGTDGTDGILSTQPEGEQGLVLISIIYVSSKTFTFYALSVSLRLHAKAKIKIAKIRFLF